MSASMSTTRDLPSRMPCSLANAYHVECPLPDRDRSSVGLSTWRITVDPRGRGTRWIVALLPTT